MSIPLLIQGRHLGESRRGREVRERGRISLREMAGILGINPSALSRLERGQERPSRPVALRWAEAIRQVEDELAKQAGREKLDEPTS